MVINFREVASRVEFRSVFRSPSRKFKILANPNILAHESNFDRFFVHLPDILDHGKSYEHGFAKKRDSHKLCTKSRVVTNFNRFFVHRLGNSKYWPFPIIIP
ncbi:hypothetical protein BHM03_00060645 [Ensete ventricosum]|nr:hypothetical protein BHM03_00060645 [Ensete ventricosum]